MQTRRVLIVGGGSAGWTAAAYLNAALNIGDQQIAEISLVESPDVPRIGVGEATIPNINRTLAAIGIDELEFMKACDATFKASIRFVNWLDNERKIYHHPFSRFAAGLRDDAGRRWLMSDRSVPFMNTMSASVWLNRRLFLVSGLVKRRFRTSTGHWPPSGLMNWSL